MDFVFASPSDVTLTIIEDPSDNDDHKTKTALFHVDRSKLIASSEWLRQTHRRLSRCICPPSSYQLNAARGRLRTILQRLLFEDVNVTIDHARCGCAAQNVFSYMRELHIIGVKPLDSDIHKNCVRDILDRLENFSEVKMGSVQRCGACSRPWKRVVEHARRQVESYFDGLCLDCMQNHPDENSEYWALGIPRHAYDTTCRIRHGEPTWYFSFMGLS